MANRRFIRNGAFLTLTPDVVKLFGYVAVTTTGAITAASTKCDGFSISRSGVGRYLITLDDKYERFLGVNVTLNGSSGSALVTDTGLSCFTRGAESINSGAARTFSIQFCKQLTATATSTYVDADIETNAEFTLEITLKNSQVKGAQL
jgi:hypothetical protein